MIEANPAAYVAQERVRRSTAPVWSGQDVSHSYISLRAFAVSTKDNYEVMPGGLARVAALGPLDVSLLEGERSKDTWVLSEGPVSSVTLLSAFDEPLAAASRRRRLAEPCVPEHFFWLGRQSVRAESLGKLIRAGRAAAHQRARRRANSRTAVADSRPRRVGTD